MFSILEKVSFLIDKKLKKKLVFMFFISIIGTFLETLGVGIILPILTVIVDGKEALQQLFLNFPFVNNNSDFLMSLSYNETILYALAIIILVFFLKTIFFMFLTYRQNEFSHQVDSEISKKFFGFYLNQDYSYHINRNSSELFRNVTDEVKNFRLNLMDPILVLSVDILVILAISALVFFIEPIASLIVGFFIILCSVIYINFNKKRIGTLAQKRQVHDALKIQHLKQGLNGIKEIKISGKENEFLSIFDIHNLASVKSRADFYFWHSLPRYILEFTGVFGLALLAIILVYQNYDLKSFLPTMGLFAAATFRLLPSASRIVKAFGQIRFGYPSADLLAKELNHLGSKKNTDSISEKKEHLEFNSLSFKNISFQYSNSDKQVLNDVSIDIKKGDKIGIIGTSGSGKSTFVDILTGLIDPTGGKVLLNGKTVDLNQKNWHKIIGYVPQFIFLTDDTIIKNIAFGAKENDLNLNSVKKATYIAELENFISTSRQGLKTMI